MNKKFRKLLSGFVTSVGVMSSLVCPCVQAKWGSDTHAMTDDEFDLFYKTFMVDIDKYRKTHTDILERRKKGDIDKFVNGFKENLKKVENLRFQDMINRCYEPYQSSLTKKNVFSDSTIFSFVVLDYFRKNNIKSAYMRMESCLSNGGDPYDVVIYEGNNGEWFVADLGSFMMVGRNDGKFDSAYLKFPLGGYIGLLTSDFRNFIFTGENVDDGCYFNCSPLDSNQLMFLPDWVKNSGACNDSFKEAFLVDKVLEDQDVLEEDLRFTPPEKVVSIDELNKITAEMNKNNSGPLCVFNFGDRSHFFGEGADTSLFEGVKCYAVFKAKGGYNWTIPVYC